MGRKLFTVAQGLIAIDRILSRTALPFSDFVGKIIHSLGSVLLNREFDVLAPVSISNGDFTLIF